MKKGLRPQTEIPIATAKAIRSNLRPDEEGIETIRGVLVIQFLLRSNLRPDEEGIETAYVLPVSFPAVHPGSNLRPDEEGIETPSATFPYLCGRHTRSNLRPDEEGIETLRILYIETR